MAESLTIKINGDTKQFQNAVKGLEVETAKLQKDLSAIATKASIAFAGLTATVTGLIATYRTQEQAERKLETALTSTSYAAGVSADELKNLASELQSVSTFGDEAIIEAQALLLTFTKIGRDVFPQATESILNMSAALGTDLKSSTVMLGKALNDPIAGVTALTRAGVQLTETQKEQIKTQTELGNVANAQKIILKELEVQFGGQARATAEGTGRFIQLSNTLGDVAETIGKHLVPPLSNLARILNDVLGNILKKNGEEFGKIAARSLVFATSLAGLTAGFALFTKAIIAARVAVTALSVSFKTLRAAIVRSGIGLLIIGIGTAIDQLLFNFDNFKEKTILVFNEVGDYLENQFNILRKEFNTTFVMLQSLMEAIIALPEKLVETYKGIGSMIKDFFIKPTAEAAAEYPDLIQRMIKDGNDKALEENRSYGNQLVENTKETFGRLKEIIMEDRAEKKEMAEQDRNEAAEMKILQEEAEAEALMQKSQRERQHLTTKKAAEINHEKFIMAAQKRELANYHKSAEIKKKIDKDRSKDRSENLRSTLGTISTLQSSSNSTLFNIGRAGALAMAYIDGKAAVIKALASAPPPFNYALATAVGLAVAAQIGQIAGASPPKMNDGGIIMGAPGVDQNLAMVSRGELVVPTRNFEEVVGAVAGNRDAEIFGNDNQVGILIGFDSDEAGQVLTAQQIENQNLGISIEEVS
tara:strand:+ start:2426 stop:4531 length:2106 start_codon:yes stop_codon:yes gene_type:complete